MDLQRLADLADPRIKAIWDQKNTQISSRLEYAKLGLKDFNTDILNPQFEPFTGLGGAQPTSELEPYNRQDFKQVGAVTITPQKYTVAANISEESFKFNLWPRVNNITGAIANGLKWRVDTDAAKIFYLGNGTTFSSGSDGGALFATHTLKSGSTLSNTTTNTLNYDNLKTAAQAMDRMTDDVDIQLLPSSSLRLIVPREKMEKAQEILRSIGNPDSANRVSNVFNNGNGYIDLIVSNYIPNSSTYNSNWFLVDMERANQMAYMVWGWRPKFDRDKVVNNGSVVYTGSVMEKPGFTGFQWAYGSTATS